MAADDSLWRNDLAVCDPELASFIDVEAERQERKLILIASESLAPRAVRECLASPFQNIYAEGYPNPRMTRDEPHTLSAVDHHLTCHRRYSDRRYYKGCDYVNFVETLAQARCAALFANERVPADEIFVNVQPLSGAAANNAVYQAFLQPGDVVMGMELSHGGHLTHGHPMNRSGRTYTIVPYLVNRRTGRLDYDQIESLAREHKPRMIIAGYSAYPWSIDWSALRRIADAMPHRCIVLADIAHPAGLVVAGLFPNPVGYADVVSFTTHKTLCGPRGAVLLTTAPDDARAIDTAVFPGEQGGPHLHAIAAKAVAFRLAATPEFRRLQQGIVANAAALAQGFARRGLTLAYGGTDTHMCLIDLKGLKDIPAAGLDGEMATRILDLANLVANKNTISDDVDAAHPTGVRFGTTWVTQRGLGTADMDELADIVHSVLARIHAFHYVERTGPVGRGKIEMAALEEATARVAALTARCRHEDGRQGPRGYPYYNVDPDGPPTAPALLEVSGLRGALFLADAGTADVLSLDVGQTARTLFLDADAQVLDACAVTRVSPNSLGQPRFVLVGTAGRAPRLTRWLRGLSDGYFIFDRDDVRRKVEGPATVNDLRQSAFAERLSAGEVQSAAGKAVDLAGLLPAFRDGERIDGATVLKAHPGLAALWKPYFVGQKAVRAALSAPAHDRRPFADSAAPIPVRHSALYDEHLKLTAPSRLIEFGGWVMPVRYTTIGEEHHAVRHNVGLFDVTHMGVLEVSGPYAARFLDLVTTNFVQWILPGQTQYGFLLDPDGAVRDDLMVYCVNPERYVVIVNAANAERDLAWMHAVNSGRAVIDPDHPDRRPEREAVIRDLKDPASGDDRRVDIALQGPFSRRVLLQVVDGAHAKRRIEMLDWGDFIEAAVDGVPAMISATGYTGAAEGFEMYVHPAAAPSIWRTLLRAGQPHGIRPCGLGARDSTRTEAGLPLHGHDLAGPYRISPIECGYASFVKFHKPFFVGRQAMVENDANRTMAVVRFRLAGRDVRMVRMGDPVVSARGEHVGWVTSATAADRVVIGLAWVRQEEAEEGRELGIYTLPAHGRAPTEPPKDQLRLGDRLLVSRPAVVLSRFCRFEGPDARVEDVSHQFRKKALTDRPAGG
jgi:glycine hydroxymethyltransferase